MEIWTTYFSELAPVGHVLRKALPDRWLRVHSLPQSKRYPESDVDLVDYHGPGHCSLMRYGCHATGANGGPLGRDSDDGPESICEDDNRGVPGQP